MTSIVANQQAPIVAWGMTRDQLDLLKRTVAEGTSDDEFALFMTTATRLGLDPFAKQIYAVKRPAWDRRANAYIEKMTIQVGIDGFRAVADRTGANDGQDGPFWCGDDGVWKDAWLADEAPAAAKVVVYKRGCAKPFTGIATFRSYVQRTKDGKVNRQWDQMPDVMLAKCAEALALRKAFPAQLSGVYSPEEMGQAENDNRGREREPDMSPSGASPRSDAGLIDAVNASPNDEALTALVPRLNALPKGTKDREMAMAAFHARRTYHRRRTDQQAAITEVAS